MRHATLNDCARIFELVLEMHSESKFPPDVGVDHITARSLIMTAIQRNGGLHQGGTIVLVEEKDGAVEAFVIGILDRVYHIGNRLASNDLFLYASKRARRGASIRLFRGYVQWALSNPKVAKIMGSWTDALGPEVEKIEALYRKEGFHRIGAIWERDGQ